MNTFKVMFSFPFPIKSEQTNKQTMRHLFPKLSDKANRQHIKQNKKTKTTAHKGYSNSLLDCFAVDFGCDGGRGIGFFIIVINKLFFVAIVLPGLSHILHKCTKQISN